MLRMSATVAVKKALDHAVAAARSPAVPVSAGEPCEECTLAPILQAAQSTIRLPTATHRLTLVTGQSLHAKEHTTLRDTGLGDACECGPRNRTTREPPEPPYSTDWRLLA